MSKKSGEKGKQATSRQQQQEAAARRRTPWGGPSARSASPLKDQASATSQTATSAVTRPDAVRPQVHHYLDVSAVRIQEWLARTPDLKFRRGASVMLSEATGRDAWPDRSLPKGMAWNTQAGDLDGVVSLVMADRVAEGDVAGCLAAAAREVTEVLRGRLPLCPIQAVAGAGDSYADAYREIEEARSEGRHIADLPAAAAELVLAKPCDVCRAEAAEYRVEVVGAEKEEDLCAECKLRVEAAGGTKGAWERRSPRPERRMKGALVANGMNVRGFPDDFGDLAMAGARDGDDAATQLCLIYADGNRVGAFLSEAADYARRRSVLVKADIVHAVDDATLAALADAIIACLGPADRPPVQAHLAGGDDLMVSVRAADAWPFLCCLLSAFRRRISLAVDWPDPVRKRLPSLSAGLVFHHMTAPFPDVVRLAKVQLDMAKKATRGEEASAAFLDLTADGGLAPAGRDPLKLTYLDRIAPQLAQIARVPRAHRETLIALHRLCAEHDTSSDRSGRLETPAEALARRVVDLGHQPLWEAVTGRGATAQAVRAALESDPGKRMDVRRILDLARWWPPTSAASSPPGQPMEGIPA